MFFQIHLTEDLHLGFDDRGLVCDEGTDVFAVGLVFRAARSEVEKLFTELGGPACEVFFVDILNRLFRDALFLLEFSRNKSKPYYMDPSFPPFNKSKRWGTHL